MSFISDLLIEISSFRIRIGNKLNALKTLIDTKANIDGTNIPLGTKWQHLNAGGLGDYTYVDMGVGSTFERVMVWDNGGWFWTNKSGFQTWAGIGFPSDLETTYKTDLVGAINEVNEKTSGIDDIGGRNLANPGGYSNNYLSSFFYVSDYSLNGFTPTLIDGKQWIKKTTAHTSLRINATPIIPNKIYTWSMDVFLDPLAGSSVSIRIASYSSGSYNMTNHVITNTPKRIYHTFLSKSTAVNDIPHLYDCIEGIHFANFQLQEGAVGTNWHLNPSEQISDWGETDSTKYSFIKNKPTIPTVSDYITTNTNQTGLSGNKTTSGQWVYSSTSATPITLKRSNNVGNSTINFLDQNNEGFNIGMATKDVFAIGYSADIGNVANRWMWVDNTGLVSSQSGFSKTGATNTDMLLGSGGHRPVSDFALAGSLGNYLPLAGGTMGTNAPINWNGNGLITINNLNRLRLTSTASVLSGNGGNVHFRPMGDGVSTNEVVITTAGQINTTNHGNSSQWRYEDYGLGRYVNLGNIGATGLDTTANQTGFYYAQGVDSNIIGAPNVKLIQLGNSSISNNVGQIVLSHTTNRIGFRTSQSLPIVEFWHSGNFNPSQLVYTGSNGINVTGQVISPTYGTTAGTIAQGNDTRINNGQTAFGWGNHAGLYTQWLNSVVGADITTPSTARFNPDLTNPTNEHYAGITYGNNGNVTGQLFTHYQTGESYLRSFNTSFSAWQKILTDLNISSYNFTTLPLVQTWVNSQNFSTQTLTAGTNISISGNVISATNTNTVTRLRGTTSGTYTSGDLTLLAGANTTITQSGANITIASTNTNTTYTAGTGLSLSGTTFGQAITTSGTGTFVTGVTQTANGFQVNLGTPPNTNTTYSAGAGLTLSGTTFSLPITYSGTGNYVSAITQTTNGLTVTRSTLPASQTVNNGTFTVQGTGSLTGSGSTSANASANTAANLDLTSAEKSRIQEGVDANAQIPALKEGVDFHHVANASGYTVTITQKKTIVNVAAGLLDAEIYIDDAPYIGYELAINGCHEWSAYLNGSIRNSCLDEDRIIVADQSRLFWWDGGQWIQAI